MCFTADRLPAYHTAVFNLYVWGRATNNHEEGRLDRWSYQGVQGPWGLKRAAAFSTLSHLVPNCSSFPPRLRRTDSIEPRKTSRLLFDDVFAICLPRSSMFQVFPFWRLVHGCVDRWGALSLPPAADLSSPSVSSHISGQCSQIMFKKQLVTLP